MRSEAARLAQTARAGLCRAHDDASQRAAERSQHAGRDPPKFREPGRRQHAGEKHGGGPKRD